MAKTARSLIVIVVLLIGCLASAFFLAESFLSGSGPLVSDERSIFSSLFLFLLINVNIIVIMVLAFLMVRNAFRLVIDRRRNILGSRLRTRLVAAFVGLSLLPTIVLFLIAKGILGSVLQGWFAPQVSESVDNALTIARMYYDLSEARLQKQLPIAAYTTSETLNTIGISLLRSSSETRQRQMFEAVIENLRVTMGVVEVAVVSTQGEILIRALDPSLALPGSGFPRPNVARIQVAATSLGIVRPEQAIEQEYIRAYQPISVKAESRYMSGSEHARYVLVVTDWVPPQLSDALVRIVNSYDDYKETQSFRRPLASSYLLMLVGGTLLICFIAIWVGFKLAGNISEPIKLLAEGTSQLAHGNLDYELPHIGDDELGTLVDSFNVMTRDLRTQADELRRRRRYMETVLESVDIGVVSLDPNLRVTTCNSSAATILRLPKRDAAVGKTVRELLSVELADRFDELMVELQDKGETVTVTVSVPQKNDVKHVQVTITELRDDRSNRIGSVILLDDLTELTKAQRLAAWRDVARRIAHEIKNPLTPIQLSAQRIQRRFAKGDANKQVFGDEKDVAVITECTSTIVEQVQALRTLVNEFSRFARMPKVSLQDTQLNEMLKGLSHFYKEAHSKINFELRLGSDIPVMPIDREQLNRALVNLLDNAVSAVQEIQGEKQIVLSSTLDSELGIVTISVSDNGPGVSDHDKARIFEPYFSRKKGGTGLGLAIVASIVADHNGFVRVRDNYPHGVVFVIELPVRAKVGDVLVG